MAFTPINPGAPLAYPHIRLQWSPTTDVVDSPVWVDITSRLREWSWGFGRNDELGDFEPGSGYVLLDNRDRALDPTYTAGPWYGNIKPRRRFRLTYRLNPTDAATELPGFSAYARGFPQSWPAQGADAVVRVELVDGIAVLATYDLAVGFSRPAEDVDDRIAAVLDAVGITDYAVAQIAASHGIPQVAAIEVTDIGTSALAHIRQCATSANGQFYADPDGQLVFAGQWFRLNRFLPGLSIDVAFTDSASGSGVRYDTSFEPVLDDNYLWNHAIVTGTNEEDVKGESSDAAAADEFWPMVKTVASVLAWWPDRQSLAEYIVYRYAQPGWRLPEITVQGGSVGPAAPAVTYPHWAALLGLSPVSVSTVKRFADSGSPMSFSEYVEGVRHTARPGGPWEIKVAVSPADTTTYWVLQDATYGAIDSTNHLAP